MKYALQTTVLSLSALRRLRFPNKKSQSSERDTAARAVLAALGLLPSRRSASATISCVLAAS
jgi:CRISPR-associated protein Csb1